MGLDVAKVAVDHLDPNKSTSVIRKLQSELKGSSDTSPRKTNYLSILYGHLQAVLRGHFRKSFLSLT